MKKKVTLLVIILTGMMFSAKSQTNYLASNNTPKGGNESPAPLLSVKKPSFKFAAMPQSIYTNDITEDMAGNHTLGEDIAKKMYSFNKLYCTKEPVAPGNSATKTSIRKPEIFHSVKKIEGLLKTQLKKGEISLAAAHDEYDKVLDVALNIFDENTKKFEEKLSTAKGKADQLLAIYLNDVELERTN